MVDSKIVNSTLNILPIHPRMKNTPFESSIDSKKFTTHFSIFKVQIKVWRTEQCNVRATEAVSSSRVQLQR